jgi:hypothetical protein
VLIGVAVQLQRALDWSDRTPVDAAAS